MYLQYTLWITWNVISNVQLPGKKTYLTTLTLYFASEKNYILITTEYYFFKFRQLTLKYTV